jgi:hypothetical protein
LKKVKKLGRKIEGKALCLRALSGFLAPEEFLEAAVDALGKKDDQIYPDFLYRQE